VIGKRRRRLSKTSILPVILKFGRPWGTGGCLWRKEIISDLKWIDSRTWEDYAFDVDAAILCNDITCVEDELVFYDTSGLDKLSNNNLSKTIFEKRKSLLHISNSIKNSKYIEN